MRLTKVDRAVLGILAVQTPGYLIGPSSTAFAVEGMDALDVEERLVKMEKWKLVAHITTEVEQVERIEVAPGHHVEKKTAVLGDDGEPLVIAAGWHVTEEGRALASAAG